MDLKYTNTMENGINDKSVLLQFIDWNNIVVDVGCSTGALSFELATAAHQTGTIVWCLEPDEETFERLEENVETFSNVLTARYTLEEYIENVTLETPVNFVLSSVMHHMIFHRRDANDLIKKLFGKLPTGSRVLIRDGVAPSRKRSNEKIGLVCHPNSLSLAKEFFQRFGEWHHHLEMDYQIDGCTVWAERWLLVEMLMTITWGKESMSRECYEHYTILGIEDYIEFFENMGYDTLYAESIIQPGYYEFLPKLGKLINQKGYEIPLPFTNQILCFEKL